MEGFLLKSTVISTVLSVFQDVMTAPEIMMLNLLTICRLVTAAYEAEDGSVICKLQEFDRGVFASAVVRKQGEEQWGEHTSPGGASADYAGVRREFRESHWLLPICKKAGDPLTGRGEHRELS